MRRFCGAAGASFYMLLDAAAEPNAMTQVVVSNWPYDAVLAVGSDGLAKMAEGTGGTFLGTSPRPWHPQTFAKLLECKEIAILAGYGQQELFSLTLAAGGRRYTVIFSAGAPGRINTNVLRRVHMACCYVLSHFENGQAAGRDAPLSARERECLFWVSEGKTAEEVALILEISANTVNSYVAHAIQKLAASNRAMAIATAIRRGFI
ncbi:DNA-binding CsgD family transcriptional regulator [Mesorhizobium sp. J18]|uniref:helix-turn-helix domain-containing protein n=1 Tax=Mesorhizobium sp. J18 TaxID=935263 RepID=UPI001199DC7F|nr:LuxR C-terminal-related transcriptional regulator [Mesorhizobium sp. J18]TWH00126.1 DNA-binding CsgD family transcriptional regulator [Mesorhizobium sp. J18]